MLQYVHGGDIQTYIDRHGFAPLDLSANINPFGIPDAGARGHAQSCG